MVLKENVRRPRNARYALALGAAIIAMTGSASAMGKIALKSSKKIERTVPVDVLSRVQIVNSGGNIVVNGSPGAADITITAVKSVWEKTPKRARRALALLNLAVNPRGDLLEVRPTYPDNWDKTFEMEFFVTVPSSFRVEIVSERGAIQIRNVRDVDIQGGKGDVLLSGVRTVTVKTTSGDVEIGPTSGPVDVTTGKGTVRARLVGAVRSVRVVTAKGDVTLQIPADLDADLGITTTSGVVATRGLNMRDAQQTPFGVRATLNDGGIPIEVTSTKGAVTVTTGNIGSGKMKPLKAPAHRATPPPAPAPVVAPPPAPAPDTTEQVAVPEETPAGADTVETPAAEPVQPESAAPDTSGAEKAPEESAPSGATE